MSANKLRALRGPMLAVLAGIALSGCYEDDRYRYLGHGGSVTLDAGDAPAANKAIHTIDPWSAASNNTKIDQDGKRAAIAVKRYETNTSIEPRGLSADPDANGNGDLNGIGPAVGN
jgi:hypothetical protein